MLRVSMAPSLKISLPALHGTQAGPIQLQQRIPILRICRSASNWKSRLFPFRELR